MSLNVDLIYEILKRVDGMTLANVGCASSVFKSVTTEEHIWEELCWSQWPSTRNEEVISLISSLGGFRKFYADCYPMIFTKEMVSAAEWSSVFPEEEEGWQECYDSDDGDLNAASASDFVSIVDVHYRNRAIYSKILWGIPGADDLHGWFFNCPFSINVVSDRAGGDGDLVNISSADGLPPIFSIESERKDGKLWGELSKNIRLSWILVNKRKKQAVNLASWSPLGGQKHWPTDNDFLIRFGSILPAENILPFRVVQCILVMKFRISLDGLEGRSYTLKLTELGMQLEDIEGAHVNGRNSLLILKRAMSCCRTMNYANVSESYHRYLKVRNELQDEKTWNEGLIDTLCALGGISAFAICCFLVI
ncbi:hypothetical protein SUGI_0197410 [Cryptomeria japonica]|uniref:F-box protein At2g27310 n=1 Tax=Cryptomeria japonica TaxID=3369 RepID=UPI002408D34F|nr:F-box protein At2g27310 [Cryptomeria japonica]GLJ12772.1 hypothetical protein SUGI_0197410 [Cryptomeria japonica]